MFDLNRLHTWAYADMPGVVFWRYERRYESLKGQAATFELAAAAAREAAAP